METATVNCLVFFDIWRIFLYLGGVIESIINRSTATPAGVITNATSKSITCGSMLPNIDAPPPKKDIIESITTSAKRKSNHEANVDFSHAA